VQDQLSRGVKEIVASCGAFAALKDDGSVVAWGDAEMGSNTSVYADQLKKGVKTIYSADRAFCALKDDGMVVSWGYFVGNSAVSHADKKNELSKDVQTVVGNRNAFAALTKDGAVIAWGSCESGAGMNILVTAQLRSGVKSLAATGRAFAAVKVDGSVVTWGDPTWGGDSSGVIVHLLRGVDTVIGNGGAFAALKDDGSLVTWGSPIFGGDSSCCASQLNQSSVDLNALADAGGADEETLRKQLENTSLEEAKTGPLTGARGNLGAKPLKDKERTGQGADDLEAILDEIERNDTMKNEKKNGKK
jgi:alpha-tubulin suppressor-like RCC1 family protein